MTNTDVTHASGAYRTAEIVTGGAKFGADILGHDAAAAARPRKDGLFAVPKAMPSTPRGLGFVPRSELFHRIYNQAIGTVFVLLVLPLLVIISAILLVAQGRPIFYRGERVGQNGTTFGILKFRSLDPVKAAELTKDKPLEPGMGAETRMGLFLRDTRLDELPQLLNVMLGDMNLCGPRPVRPEIMEIHKAEIPNYEDRFKVKPGLIGPTQAMMYHGTSKSIRSRLNNRFCRTQVSYRMELALVFTVAACVFARTLSKSGEVIAKSFSKGDRNAAEALADRHDVRFEMENGDTFIVRSIDKSSLRLEGQADVFTPLTGRLVMTLPNGQKRSLATTLRPNDDGYAYAPDTELGKHILSRYLFQQVVVPHQSEFLFAGLINWLSPRRGN